MTFISFAPNFEDVLLWRVLRSEAPGFYVDVGVADPDQGSLTRAFHERGWRGLHVTPNKASLTRMSGQRLGDVIVFGVVTAKPHCQQTPNHTLAALLDENAPSEIHFLHINLAGEEHSALASSDFSRQRPWIIIVRAGHHASWEPMLRLGGYNFVWFDGLSRFYVADEHLDRLAPHFATPPNVFDDFLRATDTELAVRIVQAETQLAMLRAQAAASELKLREETRELGAQRGLDAQRMSHIHAIEAALAAERIRAAQAEDWLRAVRSSSSWRVTAPVRKLVQLLRRKDAAQPVLAPEVSTKPAALAATGSSLATLRKAALAPHTLRVVHQYHPSSARADAITNSMLLIRRLLREQGFASEIYCDHIDPPLAHELCPASELPTHGAYVLIVHVSLGYEHFDAIAGLRAAKVLMYHNITPPKLLAKAPVLQHFARLGHQQLPQWKPLAAAALADSEYNALDLRRNGFEMVRSCPLLFDIDAMRSRAAMPVEPRDHLAFTILFVGRLVESKAQDDLLAAFAIFHRRFGKPCRLVLVGRAASSEDAFACGLQRQIANLDLEEDVELTGMIDDSRLRQCYRHADLYVSLSHHEGFGVPLIEAAAHGVPVLAWPCGAVPHTMGEAIGVLRDRSPKAVAERMLDIAADPDVREVIIARQMRALDRFRLAHHLPVLLEALALAGASAPPPKALREVLIANMNFTITGHLQGSYSLAAINRDLARSIEAVRPGIVRLVPVAGERFERPADIAALVARPKPGTGPEVVISQHYPVLVPDHSGDLVMALFFWEETVIPLETVRMLNAHFGAVLAPSDFVAKTLIDSGVSVPVRKLNPSPNIATYRSLGVERAMRERPPGPFRLLHVSSCFPRKGVDVLLAAYARAFRRGDPVVLIIKGFPNPHNDVAEQIEALRADDPGVADIILINEDISQEALLDLYRTADVMVLPTRGEGFNLPAAEAMAAHLPLIVTGFGGQLDFCDTGTARLLKWQFAPSATHLASTMSLWAEPSVGDLVAALHEAVHEYGEPKHISHTRVRAAGQRIDEMMNDMALMQGLVRTAADIIATPRRPPSRIAWITTWNIRCGVAEYTRQLTDAWPADGRTAQMVILADSRTEPEPDALLPCRIGWRIGAIGNALQLAVLIAQEDPHVVVIQHQPANMAWSDLAALLCTRQLHGRVITVTLHNTSNLEQISTALRREVTEALLRATRVIVHTLIDLERLRSWGLCANVMLMPHGTPGVPIARSGTRPLSPHTVPVIGCHGFFLPGKGINQLIATLAILRQTWPALRLRLVNANYGTPESEAEIAFCRTVAQQAGVAEAIEWHTEFLPIADSISLLQGCDLIVLPYQTSGEASSAAVRSALAAAVPVAVTPLALFDDAGSAVARLSGLDPASMAEGIAALLYQTDVRSALSDRGNAWMEANAWPKIAERMSGMLQGLHLCQ